jgi:type III secretion protein L
MPFHTAIHVNQLDLSIRGRVIRADEWQRAEQAHELLAATRKIKANAEQAALLMREQAYEAGLDAGTTIAKAELATALSQLEIARARQLAQNEQLVAQLALAVVDRLLPKLRVEQLVPDLVSEALSAAFAEQFLTIRVHPTALEATREQLVQYRSLQPAVANIEVVADAQLDNLSCVIVSEAGEVRGDLNAQLAGIRQALLEATQSSIVKAQSFQETADG